MISIESDDEEIREVMGEGLLNNYTEKIRNSGILSLSEINDNILMWSHYADQHQGICIEFERRNKNDLSNNNSTLPVRYSIKKPILTLHEQLTATESEQKEIKRSLVYAKSADWSYEREWRVVKDIGDRAYKLNANITAIIFGVKTPDHSIETIYQLITKIKKNIEFKRARLKADDFGIEIIKYDPKAMKFVENSLVSPLTQLAKTSAKTPAKTPSTVTPPSLAPTTEV